jgi:hypothetical protein
MTGHEIAHTLGTHSKNETSWMVKCVCHEDKSPSMRITDKDGQILVYCIVGCSGHDIVQELKNRGMWPESTREQKMVYTSRQRELELDRARIWIAVFDGYELKKTKADWMKYWGLRKKYRL